MLRCAGADNFRSRVAQRATAAHRTVVYFQIFAVASVVMGLSHTIAKERIFKRIRDALGGRETLCGYMVSCPYCNSHWLAFLVVPLTHTYVIDVIPALGFAAPFARWFLSSIFITVMAAFLRIAFYFVDESQGLVRREIMKTEAEAKVAQKIARAAEEERPSTH